MKSLLIILLEIKSSGENAVGSRSQRLRMGKRGLENHRRERVLTREPGKDACG